MFEQPGPGDIFLLLEFVILYFIQVIKICGRQIERCFEHKTTSDFNNSEAWKTQDFLTSSFFHSDCINLLHSTL